MPPVLTIVIPTFNRPDHVQNLVGQLLPQRDPRWKLLIVDNHSPVPVRDLVPADVAVIRNVVNIDSAGNYPRCFELMDTDWVWMIGDDDLVDVDAIEHVLSTIAEYPDAAILNFGGHGLTDGRKVTVTCKGFDEFLQNTDSMTHALWMSANVYARKWYWPHLTAAYQFASTRCSHFVLLMIVLLRGGTLVQLPRAVCGPSGNITASNHGDLMNTVMGLANIPMTKCQRREFACLMQKGFLKFSQDVAQCAFHLEHKEDRDEILYMYSTRWTHWSIARGSLGLFLVAMMGRVVLGNSLGRKFIRAAVCTKETITGRKTIRRPHVPRAPKMV